MTGRAEQVFSNALTLPINERAELAERLFSSLNISQDKIDKLWAKEAEDRINAFERGKIKTVTAKEVFNKIESRQK
jgi:putative addiction module component (TIGR02574 family)